MQLYKDFKMVFDDKITFFGTKITKIEGFARSQASFDSAKRANGVGDHLYSSQIGSNTLKLEVEVSDVLGDTLVRYFRAKSKHECVIGTRRLHVLSSFANLTWPSGAHYDPTLVLEFYAPDPYWYDTDDFGQNIAGVYAGFGFPWTATIADGITWGYRIYTDQTNYENQGDEPVGFVAVITAARGDVVNPGMKHLVKEEHVELDLTMSMGDVLVLSTQTLGGVEQEATLNGANVFGKVTNDSLFFQLDVGKNFLSFTAADGADNMDVELRYSPAYLNGMVVSKS